MKVWNAGPNQLTAFGHNFIEEKISNVALFTTGVIMPVMNQAYVIYKEGPHPGGAYDPNNKVDWAVPYTIKLNGWSIEAVPQGHLMYGDISFDEGKQVMGAAFEVFTIGSPKLPFSSKFGSSVVQKSADKAVDFLGKDVVLPEAISGALESVQLSPPKPANDGASDKLGGIVSNTSSESQVGPAPNQVVPMRDLGSLNLFPWMNKDASKPSNQSETTGRSQSPHRAHAERQRERTN